MHRIFRRRGPLLACLTTSLLATTAAQADVSQLHAPPRAGKQYLGWFTKSLSDMHPTDFGDFRPFYPDEVWARQYLADPNNVYSSLEPRLFSGQGEFAGLPKTATLARSIAWDLGLDKALPGWQAPEPANMEPELRARVPEVRANLIKAGLSMQYFDQAYKLGGFSSLSTLNAELAVAMQVLDHWVSTATPDELRAEGIREDVLLRARTSHRLEQLSDEDLAYLADILRSELSVFRSGGTTRYGNREIPTPLRIARVAAAYRITQGYSDKSPCFVDGTVDHTFAGRDPRSEDRPICTNEATDRVVYAWYRAERKRQILRAAVGASADQRRMMRFFENIRPAWAGAYPEEDLLKSNRVEVVDAQLALHASGAQADEIRFLQFVERANLVVHPGGKP